MAILTVGQTSTYASIAAAMVDAVAGDTISLENGYGNETATISLNGLTVDGGAASTGIVLQLANGIAIFTLTGTAPIAILDGPDGNNIVGNAGDNVITVSSGVDAVDGGLDTDRLVVDYRLATGSVTGNSTSNFTEAGGGGRSVTITDFTIENFTVLAGGQADTLTTGDGNDFINVFDGANTVTAGDGDNTVFGGADADTFTAGNGNNVIDAGDGANTVTAGDGGNVIAGGDGTNVLTSGAGDDTITSGNGAATIVAGGGSDRITLQGGAATVDAGPGNDTLTIDYAAMLTNMTGGITGGDLATGYTGHVEDSAANSVDFVATENFIILAGSGNDALVTGDGIDAMEGNDGNDTLTSGDGNDQFTGGVGDDALNGGAGLDTAFYSGARSDYAITFDMNGMPTLVTDLRGGSPDGTDTLAQIEMTNFAINSAPTGSVIITGTPTEDQILSASNTLADPDGMGAVSYQWRADGSDIAGATNATFALTQAEVGTAITVVASYTDGQSTAETVTSAATPDVANVNDLPTGSVNISGTAAEGETLTASNTLADEDGMGAISYQWRADGSDIGGATNATFALTQAEVGTAITVVASYTDQQGTDESVGSLPTPVTAPTPMTAPPLPFYQYTMTATNSAGQTEAVLYEGPVAYLTYAFAGSAAAEAVFGTASNDFIHLGAEDDAANGGDGDDVMDGGTGSNFLSGGAGRDVFFLDGRNGETTWSTITDWQAGEELALWGWVNGVSQATWLADAGVEGYRGATLHADLDNNGAIDTSVTWAGLTQADLPTPTQHDGLLWFA